MSRRSARRRLREVTLWDGRTWHGCDVDGMVAFGFRAAPPGLATRRQLRATGLCPGGHDPYALFVWHPSRAGRAGFANLYRVDLARPKRVPSSAQMAALDKALAARRARETCSGCGEHVGYRIPARLGVCYSCADWPHREAAA